MRTLAHLFANNRTWAAEMVQQDPEFFRRLAQQQTPPYFWIGCADSRVPANQIVGLLPGQMFVHRNVANLVIHTDLNCLSALQYAVEALRVSDVIVCGHYGCGGVRAALRDERLGLIENWLRHVQDVYYKYRAPLDALPSEEARQQCLCELNVLEQVANVCRTTIVRQAWAQGHPLAVHGWIYDIRDGLLQDLGVCLLHEGELPRCVEAAQARLAHWQQRAS